MASFEFLAVILSVLGLSVSIIYYANVMQNANKTQKMQLETRQAQLFMQLVNRYRDDTKDLDINKSLLYIEIDSFEDFMRMYETEECFIKSVTALGGFYESVGVMVREGYIPIRLVALMWAGTTRRYWEKLEPFFSELREVRGFPRAWSETEYLYHELMKYIEEHPELAT
jgi:hypothetical protein